MKTLGQVLSSYREKKRLSISALSQKTAIPESIIEHLEADAYGQLPASPLVRGYVLLIAREVGLTEETALALHRRDVEPHQAKHSTPHRLRRGFSLQQNLLTPRFLSVAILLGGILLGSLYASWHWFSLSQPPVLTVVSPVAQALETSPVLVEGRTAADNTVTINTDVVSVDSSGVFRYELAVPPGERAVVVTAEDSRGRKSEKILFITVE